MFGILPKPMWSKFCESDELNRILLQTNCVLLEDDEDRKVLIETGYGDKFDAKNRSIYAMEDRWIGSALSEIEIDPESIDAVFVTHLHFDHAAGLTHIDPDSSEIHPTFPNAKIYVQQKEWDDALANKTTMMRTFFKEHLEAIDDSFELLNGTGEPIPGVRVFPVPGHTWGQQAIVFRDENGILVFPGDVMPTANHVGFTANMAYDMEPYTNTQTKRALFQQCIEGEWRIILAHEPDQPVVRVVPHPERPETYTLKPVNTESPVGAE